MNFVLGQAGNGLDRFDVFTDKLAPADDGEIAGGYPFVFHRLMQNDDLRHRFLTRSSDHLNTTFHTGRTVAERSVDMRAVFVAD